MTTTNIPEDEILKRAKEILLRRLHQSACVLSSPAVVRDYLTMHLAAHEHEVFGVLWMDAQNRLIEDETMFRGTLTQTSVYPREVVKAALHKNAAACILYHNHPSGSTEPSRADEMLTQNLKNALAMIDVRVLDHLIVAGMVKPTSFAERGLI